MSASNLIGLIIFGYLLGSIPFGFLFSKLKKIDIREVGSGSTGATNVLRAVGLKWAILVAVLDILKGIIPAYLALKFLLFNWQIVLVTLSPVFGHIFPVWLKFKGGKGVATAVGGVIVLLGWKFFLILLLVWLLILIISKVMSFTNLLIVSFLPLIFWFSFHSLAYYSLGLVLSGLIWWAHRENLKRIKEEKEPKFTPFRNFK